jgi:hypothetical protein
MRLPKTDGEKKRTTLDLRQDPYRFGSDPPVVIRLIGDVAAFADPRLGIAEPLGRQGQIRGQRSGDLGSVVTMVGVMQKFGRTP